MSWKGPLANKYWAAVALVLVALVPYLALSSAIGPLLTILSPSLHMSMQALSLTDGFANAAYALGTVVALQIAMHRPQRRMLLLYSSLFVIGSARELRVVTSDEPVQPSPGDTLISLVASGDDHSLDENPA